MMFSRRDRIPCHCRTLPLALPSSPPQLRQQVQQGQRHHRHHQMAQWPTCCFPRRSTFRGPFLPVQRRPSQPSQHRTRYFSYKVFLFCLLACHVLWLTRILYNLINSQAYFQTNRSFTSPSRTASATTTSPRSSSTSSSSRRPCPSSWGKQNNGTSLSSLMWLAKLT